MKRLSILMIWLAGWFFSPLQAEERIDLSGLWRFQLDPMGFGKTPGSELYLSKLTETIQLPGSTDEGGKGIQNVVAHVDRLSRKFEYCGQAWYQREVLIPEDWEGKSIVLSLERCHWETTLYVDGTLVGSEEHLSTPNRFDVTRQLTPGMHTLTLCIDNRLKYPMDQWNHGTTEYTQTNWNGVVGQMQLIARTPGHIQTLRLFPNLQTQTLQTRVYFAPATAKESGTLQLILRERNGKILSQSTHSVSVDTLETNFEANLPTKGLQPWDEFTPTLYEIEAVWKGESLRETFGMREVTQGKHHVQVNGRNVHLRGTLDCCVFPLTGYPATDVASWKRIFETVKAYGLNHVRFHSWCPPEAAFDAADEVGIYLQAELPMWIKDVGQYPARRDFFEREMYAILDEYGNHPSFILMCNGNENEGDFRVLEDLVKKAQTYDNRRLYSASTARTHVAADQFYTSHVSEKGWITVYEGKPSTDWDLNKTSAIDVPVIAHETGQRCMYPNFEEIKKYTGVLEPRNFYTFQERLAKHGMLSQAQDFFRATGAHTVLQYKEVNEALLRTSTSGGFQLLGLSDFPGQGSAFVGILDAFWESKGLVTPEKYRESCAPIVLLARLPKRVYTNEETFTAQLGIYHYGPENLKKGKLSWQLIDEQGQTFRSGTLSHGLIPYSSVDSLGIVSIPLQGVEKAGKYTLQVQIANGIRNEWDIWIYPIQKAAHEEMTYVHSWEEARPLLAQGKHVLLIPDKKPANGRKTHFAGHFWNPIMFNWEPMIVGTLIDHQHPAFTQFPTSYYADWQWWDILNQAVALDLTDFRHLTPVIQSIDTYEVNRKLGIAFEANVGKGKLFVLCVDIAQDMEKRPATRQLLRSVQQYVASDQFCPSATLPVYALDKLFDDTEKSKEQNATNAAIELLLNK